MTLVRCFLGLVFWPRVVVRSSPTPSWRASLLIAALGLLMLEVFATSLHGVGLRDAVREVRQAPQLSVALANLVSGVLMIVGALVVTGVLAAPWGAGDEPVRDSARRAVRLMCWTVPQLASLLGMVWLLSLLMRHVLDRGPWEAVNLLGSWLAVLLWMISVIRVVSLGRPSPRCQWPATCRGCGYSLVGRPSSGTCPECGAAYEVAVGQAVTGPAWSRGEASWLTTAAMATFTPRHFGRTLMFFSAGRRGGRFAIISALLSAAIAAVFGAAALLVFTGGPTSASPTELPWILGWGGGLIVATQMLLLTASLTMGLAFVLGLIESLVFRRNVLPLAAQAAEYLGGTMTAMALIYGAYLLFAAGVAQALSVTSGSTPQFLPLPSPPAVVAAVLVTVTLAFPPSVLLGLAYLHWRIVAGGRWNNV